MKTVVEPIGIATIFDQLRSETSCSVFGWGDTKEHFVIFFHMTYYMSHIGRVFAEGEQISFLAATSGNTMVHIYFFLN